MAAVSNLRGHAPFSPEEDLYSIEENPGYVFVLQLIPELAELISNYDKVCFIDAHTGNLPGDVNVTTIKGEYQASTFTHHMTPATVLALSQALYNSSPNCILVSVRGFQFGFSHVLSEETLPFVNKAAELIQQWIETL